MAMEDRVWLNGIDVTNKRLTWKFLGEWDLSIDTCSVSFSISVLTLVSITPGMTIKITRGFSTAIDEVVFEGQITQYKPSASFVNLTCKGKMLDAVKSGQVKSWDKDIDVEGGVGSEIFKTICDNSGIAYTSASITSTGTSTSSKIVKFIQNDEDDFQKMNELAESYNYSIVYDYDNEIVNFKPKGFTTYPVSLSVGKEIPGQIEWNENMEQMINKIKINGATVYDKINPAVFAGPATEFTLLKTPEDTEVRQTDATGVVYTRGQKDMGTIGTDFDYYVDVEQKKIVFGSAKSNIWVRYGAQVPLPVTLQDVASINLYGGPNKKAHFKTKTFNDIKDIKDAEDRGRAILAKYSTPFYEANNIPVKDDVIETNGSFKPGDIVRVIDSFTNKDGNFFVKSIQKSWPHVHDKITIGDEIWRTEDWQADQMKKVNQLFNELNKNSDILIQITDVVRDIKYERRYVIGYRKDRSSDGVHTFILGHPIFGVLGTQELGDAGTAFAEYTIIPGNNNYKEFCYDEEFYDAVNSTATMDTVNKKIDFSAGSIWYSTAISLGVTWSTCKVKLADPTPTNYTIEISADGKSTWQTVTDGTSTTITTADTTGFYVRITKNTTTLGWPTPWGTWGDLVGSLALENTYTDAGAYDEPAISVELYE